ncbi:transposase [Lactiplantibacillus pentosus]|uniref:transposase n=1 Tax=Lactiplantibacillus pentosus TaxID=1589 RepID=UPI00207A6F9D|nr:transposase [Lactiplantibacillus pentosus]USJ87947.1 transposase [Lactiplantibacillus pentosus]
MWGITNHQIKGPIELKSFNHASLSTILSIYSPRTVIRDINFTSPIVKSIIFLNWAYHPKDDYFIDLQGVRFSFYAYRKRKDKYGFVREFKEYQANKYDNDFKIDHRAFTKNRNPRKISINSAWEYFKAKERKLLSNHQTGSIYGQRKIDVESVFGGLKACLGFKKFSVRGLEKVKREAGIALMAMNIRKLVAKGTNYNCFINKKKRLVKIKERFSLISSFLKDLWHSPP